MTSKTDGGQVPADPRHFLPFLFGALKFYNVLPWLILRKPQSWSLGTLKDTAENRVSSEDWSVRAIVFGSQPGQARPISLDGDGEEGLWTVSCVNSDLSSELPSLCHWG